MSQQFDPTKTQSGMTPGTPAAPATGGFSFGTGAGDASKTLGTRFPSMSTPAQDKPTGSYFGYGLGTTQTPGFSFSTPTSTPAQAQAQAQGGLSLGTPSTTTGTSGLSFNVGSTQIQGLAPTAATTAPATGFSVPSTGTATGFNLSGTAGATSTPATGGLSFGTPKQHTGFTLGGSTTAGSATTTGLSFTTPASATTTGFSLGGTATTTAPSFSLGGNLTTSNAPATGLSTATSTPGTGFGVGNTTAATTASTGFTLGTSTTTSGTTGFSLGGISTAGGFSLGKSTASTTTTTASAGAPQTSLGTTTTVTPSTGSGQSGAINFCQLEESINKWKTELEKQEKIFVDQATQINAWDKLLIANGEKIVTLNQEVERVKLEQQQLEQELDYVVSQQKELTDCLEPLEKELASLSVSDPEREYTYRLAENLDTQLKQMSEDLKEIIECLNDVNRAQDSSDPIVQIGKILNAHMNSLQWLDQRTTLLSQKIQQIDQMHQNFRQENERSFNLAYSYS